MTRVLHDLVQGSPQWTAFRLEHFGSSEAAAMLGLSKTMTRSELLRLKHTGIGKEFSDYVQRNILDHGHAVEAMARPLIEEDIGEDLYPCTMSIGKISASCDGLTLDERIAFEHKQTASALFATVQAGEVPPEHMPQCQQILMVTGAERLIFVVSDGTREHMAKVEVLPDPMWFDKLQAGWAMFESDLASYTPPEVVEKAVAAPIQALPALLVRVTGEVTSSNLPAFKAAAETFIARIKTDLSTDNDFADAAETVKFCKDAEDRLELAKTQALEQTASVAELLRTVEHISAQFRSKRLELDKLVTRRKDEIKADIVTKARTAYATFLAALNAELSPVSLVLSQPDFAGAAKGKRTVATLQDAADGELAAAKIAANEAARLMRVKLAWFKASAAEYAFLFADLQGLAQKPVEDFQLAVQARIDAHQAAEAQRKADADRLTAEAMQKAAAIPAPAPAPTGSVTPIRHAAPAADEPAVLNLGEVCAWLGVSMTAADIATRFGIEPAARVKAATRYTLTQAEAIRTALVKHLQALTPLRAAA